MSEEQALQDLTNISIEVRVWLDGSLASSQIFLRSRVTCAILKLARLTLSVKVKFANLLIIAAKAPLDFLSLDDGMLDHLTQLT